MIIEQAPPSVVSRKYLTDAADAIALRGYPPVLLHNDPPADSGLYLIPNPGGLRPLLTEGGPPMIETYRCRGQSHRSNPWVGDSMKPKPILDWYRILRAHYRFSRIRSIRFALWLYAGV